MITPLPSGLPDILPPMAAKEFMAIETLLQSFSAYGYNPVIPSIAEFESSLTQGTGEAGASHMFRVMDIISHQMLALRCDMTTQIGRIAADALKDMPRPLRLCYAGQTLRTSAEPLKTRRQHTQIGVELFGAQAITHEGEILTVAIDALKNLSLTELSLDISAPFILAELLTSMPEALHAPIKQSVARKDSANLRALGADLIAQIVDASAPYAIAMEQLARIKNAPAALHSALTAIEQLCTFLTEKGFTLPVTIDLLEMRGFGYYNGLAYALFLKNPACEIGRGGHYRNKDGEPATGFTFYLDDVLNALTLETSQMKLALSAKTSIATIHQYQLEGYQTILIHGSDINAAAREAGATHLLHNNHITTL